MHGASRKESLTLCKIRGVIKNHLSQYTAGLNARSDAWQQYGEFNEAFGTFDFCPDKFIQPLKDRMIFQIQFQEMMAHTVRAALPLFSYHRKLYFSQSELSIYHHVLPAIVCWIRRRHQKRSRQAEQRFDGSFCPSHCPIN